ncbi:MAG: HAMP domain-containing protein [Sphingomonadales bacterium]|nr:HAMP domain-containing protein [Sphingomonadales bacterium]MDE2168468.1 HAMP domain-containing protein [Sphingomonadales bacterium]
MSQNPSFQARRWMPRWWRRAQVYLRRVNIFPWLLGVAIASLLAAWLSAYIVLSDQSDKGHLLPSVLTTTLLIGMLVPAMAILMLIGRILALRRAAASIGSKGKLHVQLVFLFSMIAAVPTLLVVIFASILFQQGVEFWFSDNSRGMLENANKLAQGYYEQSQRDVSDNAVAMAYDVRDALSRVSMVSREFTEGFSYQVLQRKLDEVAILQKAPDGHLNTAVFVDPTGKPRDWVTPAELRRVDAGERIVINANSDRIEAITPIDRHAGLYLFAARRSDLLSLSQGKRAENIVRAYQVLTQKARVLQLRFNVALFVASLMLVALAVWFGLRFADRQVQPLAELVAAARRVGAGNFALRVGGRAGSDEIGLLNRAFNRMTVQLELQTLALVGANQQLDERRAFIEAVLESVTAGIISLDAEGRVLLMNSSAQKLLRPADSGPPEGRALAEFAPQLAGLVTPGANEGIVQYAKGSELLTLAVKVTGNPAGAVLTFEDITRQLLDQRQAAWSDVARRIAHEIKNPLTPIQLATERLKRRYRRQIETDGELFEELTQTIIRQVGDLRKMVDEFSSFARLPKPVFRNEDPVDLARQALFLQEVARPDISFSFSAEPGLDYIACDRHQFGQAMTNVLKNATEAVEARAKAADGDYRGRITVSIAGEDHGVVVTVTDNGVGLPKDRERIVEPYVTTREKGTGLGLAIVKKIIEEHGGDMAFSSVETEEGGTMVTMRFARDPLSDRPTADKSAERRIGEAAE